jgi:hypothetical protein
VRRRALLGPALSRTVAGCGWAREEDQYRAPGESASDVNGGGGSDDESDDGSSGGGSDAENLGTSQGGEGPIEKDAEELLLRLEDLEADGWEESNVQVTGTCNTFELETEEKSHLLTSCAEVFEDIDAAATEYEDQLDRSTNLISEPLDRAPEIGDQTAAFKAGPRDGDFGETTVRLLFQDANATGRVELAERQGLPAEENSEAEGIGVSDVAEFGLLMHGRWRE